MIKIVGRKRDLDWEVEIDGVALDPAPSQRVYNHSPDGFSWGFFGSGPSQFALALMLHFTDDRTISIEYYQDLKNDIISNLQDDFVLDSDFIVNWIAIRALKDERVIK